MRKLALPILFLVPAFAHPATLTVTSLADDGSAGTLRALCASASAGDEIVFGAALAGGTIAITTATSIIFNWVTVFSNRLARASNCRS